MNLKLFADEIARFLRSPEPELLCISGAWGAGKTFAWKHYLEVAQKEKAVSHKKYAYVSLFGRNSLEDVRTAIVENTVDSGIVGGTPDLSSYENSLGLFEAGAKKLAKYAGFLPQASGYAASANRVLFMLLKEQIVCIDDLERAGKGLDSRTVLGLASDLKEQKKCKVVLLLNEESLEGDDKKEFEGQIEKVADAVLLFKPTPDECAAIGIDDGTPLAEELRAAAVALKIVNIRVIRKAQRVWMRASEILQAVDERIKKQAVSTIMLATYSRFQPKIAPSLDLIKQYNAFDGLFSKQKIDPTVAAARETLRIYGFGHADEFDLVLIEAVESGFIDKDRLVEQAAKLSVTMALADRTRSFSEAWDAFHNSVEDDADAVLDRIYESFKTDLQAVTPIKLDGTIRTFKEFGREAQAKEMLDLYITSKVADSDFWDLMSSPLGGHVVDQEIREAFANKFSSIKPAFSPENFLDTLTTKNGWDPDELAEMAKLTPDQYVAIFKKADGKTLSSIISAALYFRDVSNKDDQMTAMTSAAEEALRIIARENLLNRMRMQKFGISIDDSPAGGDPTSGDVPLAEGSET